MTIILPPRVSVLAICLCLSACHNMLLRRDRAVLATVAGVPIYQDEFKKELDRQRLEPDDSGPVDAQSVQVQGHALLDDLIAQRLLVLEAEKYNITVPTDHVEAAYQTLRSGWPDDAFAIILKARDLTIMELKTALRLRLLVRKYLREYVFSRVAVTDAEIDAYVHDHPEPQVAPEQVRARHVVLKTAEEAQKVRDEIVRGLPFDEAAMKYSLYPDGRSGGDLGTFVRGSLPKMIEDACFHERIGEVSLPVETPYGYQLFKVVERRTAHARSPTEVRDTIETLLRRGKERVAQIEKVRELRGLAMVQVKEDRLAEVL